MKSIRVKAENWIRKKAGGFGPDRAEMASGTSTKAVNVAWIAVMAIVVVLTFSAAHLASDKLVAQLLIGSLWGLFLGGTLLLFLPAKLLITIVGGILGAGTSDLAGLSEVIIKTSAAIAAIVSTLNNSLQGTVQIHPASCWVFLILILFCCIPAYWSND